MQLIQKEYQLRKVLNTFSSESETQLNQNSKSVV